MTPLEPTTPLVASGLLSAARIVALCAVLPFFGPGAKGWLLRALVSLPFAIAAWPVVSNQIGAELTSQSTLVLSGLREAIIGLSIGLAAATLLSLGRLFGGLVDAALPAWRSTPTAGPQMGQGIFARLHFLVVLVVFVTLDGHALIFEAVLRSFAILPVAATPIVEVSLVAHVVTATGSLFAIAAAAALPTLTAIAIGELTLSIAGRAAAPASMTFVLPARLLVATLATAILLHITLTTAARWLLEALPALVP